MNQNLKQGKKVNITRSQAEMIIKTHSAVLKAGIVGIVLSKKEGKPSLVVYCKNPGALIGENAEIAKSIGAQIGYFVEVQHYRKMTSEDRQQILLAQEKCLTCGGGGVCYQPKISIYGILWQSVTCPVCGGKERMS